MTFWPIYPEKYGAKGNGVNNDLTALDRAVTECKKLVAGGEGGAIYLREGAIYGVNGDWVCMNQSGMRVYGRGATVKALSTFTGDVVVAVDHEAGGNIVNLGADDIVVDINSKNAYGLSNFVYFDTTSDNILKKSWFKNITVKNNIAGKHPIAFRNCENSVLFYKPIIDGFASTNGSPTAAMYMEDIGAGANHGNFYIIHPFIATNSNNTVNGRAIWLNANGVALNRIYIGGPGSHLFNYNQGGGSIGNYAIYVEANHPGGVEEVRTISIDHVNMEDWKTAIFATNGSGSGLHNLKIDHINVEYKNPADEAGVKLINIAGTDVSAVIDHPFLETSSPDSTAINCDSDEDVWVDHIDTMLKATGTWGSNDSLKFTGSALNNNPISFHLGNVKEFGGPSAQYTGITSTRYLPVYGSAATGQTVEADQQTMAGKRYALRQLVLKPDVNSQPVGGDLPVSFRVNGSSKITGTVTQGSKAEVVATLATYQEINPTDLLDFMMSFTGSHTGNIRFAAIRAICEELHMGAE